MPNNIPEVVVLRLPLYVRVLAELESQGEEVISSQELARCCNQRRPRLGKT